MKAGDKVRPGPRSLYDSNGKREIKYVGAKYVIYDHDYGDGPHEQALIIERFKQNFEVIPDFFEAGKTYTCAGDEFTVEYIENDAQGDAAIGKVTNPGGRFIWRIKRKDVFHMWQAVE